MALTTGARLGPYEILSPLGAGGMGEVYRARDTRLERIVAVKVLPPHLSSSEEMRQRFEREAKAISQLSHPHICALYDVGSHEGTEYLVMELLEGETLSDRITKGPLALEQTLRFGVQIADALDRAHRQGIVHRDLKPGNVMLTKSGVKLLDFGLSKVMEPASPASALTALPTVAKAQNLTQEGTILGTFQYMAPEQLEGRDADARTDIFAFGAVLYEMATGAKAFTGSSQASLISAILRDEPKPVSAVVPMAPPALDRVVLTCLAKDPEDRWQSAHDAARELKWIAEGSTQAVPSGAAVLGRGSGLTRLAWALAFAAIVAALVEGILLLRRQAVTLPALRAALLPAEGGTFNPMAGPMALSPDGRQMAYVARDADGRDALWVRALDTGAARLLSGAEGARYPFWSPDGRSIGFFSAPGLGVTGLAAIPSSGGAVEKICEAGVGRGGTWNREGTILYSAGFLTPISRVSLADHRRVNVTQLDTKRGETGHVFPHFLPDGRHFLYLVQRVDPATRRSESELYVQALGSEQRTLVLRAGSRTLYTAPGYLIFWWDGNLMAQAFDAKGLHFTGDAFPIAKGVQRLVESNGGIFSVSDSGLLVFAEGGAVGLAQLTIFDRGGKTVRALGAPGNYWTPHLSHDERRAAVEMIDPVSGNRDIGLFDMAGSAAPTRVTFDPGEDFSPVFSPDGSRIAFSSSRAGVWSILEKKIQGSEEEQVVLPLSRSAFLTDWSLDGRLIAFNMADPETSDDMWLLSVAQRKAEPLLRTPAMERDTAFSPDGRWIAYVSGESGKLEVYVRAFPGPGAQRQVSTSGGGQPRWRPDGKELFYLAPGGKLVAVPVTVGSSFEAGSPQVLFQTLFRQTSIAQYDVFRGGERFLINSVLTAKTAAPITIVQNWREAASR